MVYGRILYNNIKEYTPKWYPTIPYSQTVKPTLSRICNLFQKGYPKSFQPQTQTQAPRQGGDYSQECSNKTHGCGKYSSSQCPSWCSTASTFQSQRCTSQTTPIEPTMQQSQKKELTRRNSKKQKMPQKEPNDLKYTFM